jgi:hypothetical protein
MAPSPAKPNLSAAVQIGDVTITVDVTRPNPVLVGSHAFTPQQARLLASAVIEFAKLVERYERERAAWRT